MGVESSEAVGPSNLLLSAAIGEVGDLMVSIDRLLLCPTDTGPETARFFKVDDFAIDGELSSQPSKKDDNLDVCFSPPD